MKTAVRELLLAQEGPEMQSVCLMPTLQRLSENTATACTCRSCEERGSIFTSRDIMCACSIRMLVNGPKVTQQHAHVQQLAQYA